MKGTMWLAIVLTYKLVVHIVKNDVTLRLTLIVWLLYFWLS